ncbi:MAG: serine hydrolase domain-containing protein, partial [Thermoanaerobaculia bacterium]|nr:serine hydrolase domain-containing protein [Thermoanaerobaculia bacterium]
YARRHFAPALFEQRSAEGWERLAEMLVGRHAGLEVVGVDIPRPDQVLVTADSPTGHAILFTFDFAPDDPEHIAGLSVEIGGGDGGHGGGELPPLEIPAGAGEGEIGHALDGWLGGLAGRDRLSGAVLVSRHGRPIFTGAWGLASVEWQAPNRVDTRFDLGSINKSFTKVAIARLAAEGALHLDDTIADHLPGYPNPEVAGRVTIRQLVEHSAGIPDIFDDAFFRSSRALYRQPEDFLPLFAEKPLRFEPGTRFEYSNGGYMVLGAIVAAASGESYADYVERHVFGPAGMTATGFFARDEPVPNVAVGYTTRSLAGEPHDGPGAGSERDEGSLRNNLYVLPIRGNSAGSAFATVGDLLLFDRALREHRLLDPAWTRWIFEDVEPTADAPPAATGPATVGIGIAGGAPGVSSVLESDGELAVIVLTNRDEPGAETVARSLVRALRKALE